MPYCTQADISPAKVSDKQLKQLTSEDGQSVVTAIVDQAIAEADAEIDSYAGRRYTVPMSPVPAQVKKLSSDIAVYNLFKKRSQSTGGTVPEQRRTDYEDAVSFLKRVADGKANIEGATALSQTSSPTGGSFHSNDPVFTNDSLDLL